MNDSTHTIGTNWREADIGALEERVRSIDEWLEHSVDLEEMLGNPDPLTQDLRAMMAGVRTKRNDLSNEAQKLKAALMDRDRHA